VYLVSLVSLFSLFLPFSLSFSLSLSLQRESSNIETDYSGGPAPADVAQHIGRFSGMWDMHKDVDIASGQLYAPSRLPFAKPGGHYFSCIDGRANYAVMGTPGGDISEFIISLCAFEKVRRSPPGSTGLTHLDVKALLLDLLASMPAEGAGTRKKFYMHTDEAAMTRLGKAAGVSNPADASMPPDAKARVLSMVAEPEHIGCEHLRAMVMHPMEYSCRGALVQYAITAFYDLMLNGPPAIQKRLLFHVSEGYHEERGIINVYAINGFCPTYTPLVVPSVDEENNPSQYFVNHPSAVAIYRQELADFLTDRVGRQLEGRPLLPVMNEVGQGHMDRTMENLVKGKPSFAAFFTATPL